MVDCNLTRRDQIFRTADKAAKGSKPADGKRRWSKVQPPVRFPEELRCGQVRIGRVLVTGVKFLAREGKRRGDDHFKKEERTRTYRTWQEMWEHESRGRCTGRLTPQVQPWVDRRHGEVE
ncbi:hypothetical protein J6590_008592 [Homalodisca vitripennis]|nr:hypothetical protein J6590_008592 [Homalodisca vitripennis]